MGAAELKELQNKVIEIISEYDICGRDLFDISQEIDKAREKIINDHYDNFFG